MSGTTQVSDDQYVYDGDGNITSTDLNGTTTSYAYNSGNEITTGGGHTYSYDADGNELSNGNGLTMAYNALGQMTSATSAGTTTTYGYLGEGQNQLISSGSNAVHDDLLGVASQQSGTTTSYFTRMIGGEQVDERTSAGTYNYLYDAQGDIVGLTNSSGVLVNQYAYDPYGNRTTSTGTTADYFGFQNGYLDASGLYHYGARNYNPAQESWTQQDPLDQVASLTQADRYAFAADNRECPTNCVGIYL